MEGDEDAMGFGESTVDFLEKSEGKFEGEGRGI